MPPRFDPHFQQRVNPLERAWHRLRNGARGVEALQAREAEELRAVRTLFDGAIVRCRRGVDDVGDVAALINGVDPDPNSIEP